MVSLNQEMVTNMLLFVAEEFALIIDRCHGRECSQINFRIKVQLNVNRECCLLQELRRVTGVYLMIRAFAPLMIAARSGHIINISSLAGRKASG